MQAVDELDWQPEFSLVEGLKDSWDKDFNWGTYRKEADFSTGEHCIHPWGQIPLQLPLPARHGLLQHHSLWACSGVPAQAQQLSCCMAPATAVVWSSCCMLTWWGASWDW